MKKSNIRIIILAIFFALLIVGGTLGVGSLSEKSENSKESESKSITQKISDIGTAQNKGEKSSEFESLTIPYLRNRTYESSLGELDLLSNNGQYNSYLTSYDSDGLNINGLLTIPNGEEPESGWPAIVFIHGYIPPSVYQTANNYETYVDYLADNGYVVFKIDLRGHAQSEGIPTGAYYSGDYIIDTLNAYSALQNADFVDENNIGLWGHSMGGNVVFRSMVAKQDVPATVIWAGAVYTYEDWDDYSIQDNTYRPPDDDSERREKRNKLREMHGEFDPDDSFWQKVVPTNYLDGVTGALQINHAVNDAVVNIGYSRNIIKILAGTSIPHELIEYQSGGHNIAGDAFVPAMQDTVDFYDQYLKD